MKPQYYLIERRAAAKIAAMKPTSPNRTAPRFAEKVAMREQRLAQMAGKIRFPEALPVSGRKDEITAAIAANPVVIVCGETGSGKTT